ncbi:hypothetical protein Tcan_00835, partial [Toxocara canis]
KKREKHVDYAKKRRRRKEHPCTFFDYNLLQNYRHDRPSSEGQKRANVLPTAHRMISHSCPPRICCRNDTRQPFNKQQSQKMCQRYRITQTYRSPQRNTTDHEVHYAIRSE